MNEPMKGKEGGKDGLCFTPQCIPGVQHGAGHVVDVQSTSY